MIDAPLVSVIIPCRNSEKYILECLNSCSSQTYSNIELIVVDDGSSDSTIELVRAFSEEHPDLPVKVLSHPNKSNLGVAASRVLGFRSAKGKYFSLLDSDDAYEPSRIQKLINYIQNHPCVVLAHSGISIIGDRSEAEQHEHHFSCSPHTPYNLLRLPDALYRLHICNSSVLFRASAIRNLQYATSMLYQREDWLLWVLLARRGPFIQLPEPLTLYRIHPESFSFSNNRSHLKQRHARIEFISLAFLCTFPSFLSPKLLLVLLKSIVGAGSDYVSSFVKI